jgi:hypothetical protein
VQGFDRFVIVVRILIIAAVVLAAGCSRTGLLYDNGAWLAQRWVSGLVDPSNEQREAWKDPFSTWMVEHRRDLLPEVVFLLETAETEIARGLRHDRLDCLLDSIDLVYREHARRAVALATLVLRDITPGQIDHLAGELAESERDYRDKYLDQDIKRRERERLARYVDRIERWVGDLSTVQLAIVERKVSEMPDTAEDWLSYRRQQRQRLLDLLRAKADQQALARFLGSWWVDFAGQPPRLVSKVAAVRAGTIDMLQALDGTLSEGQRVRFVTEVADIRIDLEAFVDNPAADRMARPATDRCTKVAQIED